MNMAVNGWFIIPIIEALRVRKELNEHIERYDLEARLASVPMLVDVMARDNDVPSSEAWYLSVNGDAWGVDSLIRGLDMVSVSSGFVLAP